MQVTTAHQIAFPSLLNLETAQDSSSTFEAVMISLEAPLAPQVVTLQSHQKIMAATQHQTAPAQQDAIEEQYVHTAGNILLASETTQVNVQSDMMMFEVSLTSFSAETSAPEESNNDAIFELKTPSVSAFLTSDYMDELDFSRSDRKVLSPINEFSNPMETLSTGFLDNDPPLVSGAANVPAGADTLVKSGYMPPPSVDILHKGTKPEGTSGNPNLADLVRIAAQLQPDSSQTYSAELDTSKPEVRAEGRTGTEDKKLQHPHDAQSPRASDQQALETRSKTSSLVPDQPSTWPREPATSGVIFRATAPAISELLFEHEATSFPARPASGSAPLTHATFPDKPVPSSVATDFAQLRLGQNLQAAITPATPERVVTIAPADNVPIQHSRSDLTLRPSTAPAATGQPPGPESAHRLPELDLLFTSPITDQPVSTTHAILGNAPSLTAAVFMQSNVGHAANLPVFVPEGATSGAGNSNASLTPSAGIGKATETLHPANLLEPAQFSIETDATMETADSLPLLRGAAMPTVSSSPMGPVAMMGTPPFREVQQVAQSVIQSIRLGKDGPIQLTLQPDALGQLRFEISSMGDRLHIILFAERPDSMDLVRRHGEQLLNDLRLSGFNNPSLSFGDWSQRNAHSGMPSSQTEPDAPCSSHGDIPPVTTPIPQFPAASGRLDLRL